MKLKVIFILLLTSVNFIFSQRTRTQCFAIPIEENKNGKLENHIFTCSKFDWKIKIPDNCNVVDMKMDKELLERDPDDLKQMEHDGRKIKRKPNYLISFGFGLANFFTATLEPIDSTKTTNLALHKTLTLRENNDNFSKINEITFQSSSSLLKIGKYDFYRIYVKIYNAKTNELALTQEIYNSFIGNYLFSVSINYDNEKAGKELVDNFMSSLNN